MDQQKVDMFVLSNGSNLPEEQVPFVREKLVAADEEKWSLAESAVLEVQLGRFDRRDVPYLQFPYLHARSPFMSDPTSSRWRPVISCFADRMSSTSSSTFDLPATARASLSNTLCLVFSNPLSSVSFLFLLKNPKSPINDIFSWQR